MNRCRLNLIGQLEYIVSQNCHNRYTRNYDSTDGRTYRYPVHMKNPNDHDAWYTYRGIISSATDKSLGTLHYEFGANDLYIGDALNQILNFLEDRYGIDFDDLEIQHQFEDNDDN